MRKAAAVLVLVMAAAAAFAQQPTLSRAAGRFVATSYGQWHVRILTGNAFAGAKTITLATGAVALPDGRVIHPFAVGEPLRIGAETVTVTAVSGCSSIVVPGTLCMVTATFTDSHIGEPFVSSGTFGLQESLNDAGQAGGTVVVDADWTQAGGTSDMLAAATTPTGTGIEDMRGAPVETVTVNGQACVLGSTCTVADSTKITTSSLSTDSTFADNSDTKVPSQKAVKTALGSKADSGASTTVNGQTCALGSTCTVTAVPVLGPATHSTGACTTPGAYEFAQDGYISVCSTDTWVQLIPQS